MFLFLCILFTLLASTLNSNILASLQFPQYCLYYGYPTQTHLIKTKDDYTLKFFRLQAKNTTIQNKDKVLYLQHGLQDSSDTWIVNEQHLAPAFFLANKGYDVWVGNTRGNAYSSPILNMNLKKKKTFWDFSFDQISEYDLPAAFSYIHNITKKKIHYIGHSQGTMIMFAALSVQNPIITNLMASYSALGPVAYLDYEQSRLIGSLAHSQLIIAMKKMRVQELMYSKASFRLYVSILCLYDPYICTNTLSAISQKNNSVNNLGRMPVIMGHFPSGSSLKNMDHFQQIIRRGVFSKYDLGQIGNMEKYGTKQPPIYNLKSINFPINLFVGKYDKLADIKDAQRLFQELGSSHKTIKILDFGHATFIWGKDISYLNDIVKIIQDSQNEKTLIES